MARYRKNETAEQSSDEEELFSYLKKVHTVKQATHETKEASPDAYTEKSRTSNPDDIRQVSQTSETTTDVVLDNTDVTSEKGMQNSDKSTDKTFDDSETNLIDVEQHIAAQSGENKHTYNTDEKSTVKLANSEHNFEQQIEINSCTESKAELNNLGNFTDSSSIEVVEEQKTEFIAKTKNSSLLKGKDTKADDGIVSKQNPESSRESDKYYLINEKDWLSLCAKLSSTDKQTNFKEQHEPSKTDALQAGNCDKQDVSSASLTKTKPLSVKGKSMFSAFKQYNPFTKATLRKADLEQNPHQASPQKVNVTTETKKLNINSEGQTKSPFGNELNKSNNESKTSEDPKTAASPKVEIVYIRLEDGQIKYDINKSPLAATASIEETNLQAVKKLDFSEHKQELAFENRPQGDQSRATHNLQNSSQENDNWYNFPNAIEENYMYEQSNPNTSFTRADNTHYDTGFKPGMQVRFVRINNKLTRVYENVERNVVDEVLYSDDEHNKSDHQEHSSLEHCDNDQDDSFNFDDSQLVAFPLNAVDPEMIIKDDSLAQLTPSKLEFLNTSGKHDPLTPNKSEFLTPGKQDPLTPNKLEMFTPSKLELLTPSKLDILSTSELDIISDDTDIKKFDEYLSSPDQNTATAANQADVLSAHFETESPIVLKVTKSGGLVQCKSTESSPERNVHKQQNSITTNENKAQSQKSHIQNLWKTFKPVQRKSKANVKQSLSVKKSEDAGYEHIENYDNRSEQSSDEDDLTNYFSMTNHASKNSANAQQSIDLSKEKSEITSSSVSIQASFPDSSDDSSEKEGKLKQMKQKVRKRTFCEVEDRKKINYKTVKTKNAIAEAELKAQSAGKKRKGNRQILHFYKDFNYKQVEFKDFELEEAQKSKATNMDKRKVDFHIEENTALEKHPDNEEIKEDDEVQSTVKVKEVRVRKTRVNGNKEVKQRNVTLKEQGKSKGNKKSCLKTGLDQKESKMIKNSVEENETFHIEGNTASEKHPDNEKLKELDKVQSTVKVKEIKVRKRRVNGNKEVKQIKDTLKEQGKSKGNKKSCLKTGPDQKESKMIKNSVEENETGMKPECKADDNTDTYSNDESQKKIEFLEKLFQIKLKEAATDTTNKKRNTSSMKTLHEENNESVTGRKLKNRRKSSGANTVRSKGNKVLELPVAEESVENGKQVNVTNENILGVKKGKRRKDEIFDSVVSIVNKEQDLNTCQSDKTATGSRIKNKCSEKIGKGRHRDGQNTPKVNVNLEMDTLDVRKSGSNERIQNVDRASPPEVKKPKGRKRKQNITLGDQIKGSKNKAQVLQTICKCDCYKVKQAGAGSKSNNRGKIAKRKSKVSANADELKTEKLNRQMDEPSLPENVVEMEFTKLKKHRGRSKITKIAKEEKLEAKSLTNSVSDQQGFVDNIEIRPGDAGEKSKKKPSAQTTKNICKKRLSEKTKIRNTKRKKSSLNTVSSTGKSDPVQNGEFPCAVVKGNTQLVDGAIEGQLDNTIKHIEPSERSVFVNCDETLSSSIEDLSSHDGIVSILATFQPLQKASSQKLEQKTKISKRKKKESDKQNVSKSKKMKQQAEADDTFLKETEEEPVLTHEGNMSYLKLKQFKQESISYLDEDESEMPLDLSLQQTEAQEVKGSSSSEDIDKNAKRTSLKRLRDGKVLEKSISRKVASPKKLKSTRKPCSSRKIKTVTKRQEKESWKDMLDDGAFKLDCNEKMNEKHKPVNVRHMIKDILKSVKGAEKISDRHVKLKERKDGSHKRCKSNVGNTKQRVTSESDDAWLSDSGPGVSFPAFKFTGMSDSEETRESVKSQTVDNGLEISTSANSSESELDRSENDRVTEISDSKLFKQTSGRTENNYMELHHSPLKVSSSLGTNSASSENSHLTSLETKELVENSKESPEMKKNVDKLRALLDKVSDKSVVKNLQFADTVSLSDTEH